MGILGSLGATFSWFVFGFALIALVLVASCLVTGLCHGIRARIRGEKGVGTDSGSGFSDSP